MSSFRLANFSPRYPLETWVSLPFVVAGLLCMGLTSVRVATLICRSPVDSVTPGQTPQPSTSATLSECRLTIGTFLPHTRTFPLSQLESATIQPREDLYAMQAQVILQLENDAIALPPTFSADAFVTQVNQFLADDQATHLRLTQSDRGYGMLLGLSLCSFGFIAKALIYRHLNQLCER